jgi:hypothetical protein
VFGSPHDSDYSHLLHAILSPGPLVYRTLCGGTEGLKQYFTIVEPNHPTCPACLGFLGDIFLEEEVKSNEPEQAKVQIINLIGDKAELGEEDYKVLYNRAVMEGEKFDYYLPAVKDLTPEQLVDHINALSSLIPRIKVAAQAAKVTLEDRKISLNNEQREMLRLRDAQYKPKKQEDPNKPKKVAGPRRKAGTAKSDDAAELMARLLGVSKEEAQKMIDSNPGE